MGQRSSVSTGPASSYWLSNHVKQSPESFFADGNRYSLTGVKGILSSLQTLGRIHGECILRGLRRSAGQPLKTKFHSVSPSAGFVTLRAVNTVGRAPSENSMSTTGPVT